MGDGMFRQMPPPSRLIGAQGSISERPLGNVVENILLLQACLSLIPAQAPGDPTGSKQRIVQVNFLRKQGVVSKQAKVLAQLGSRNDIHTKRRLRGGSLEHL